MSHVTDVKIAITDLDALEQAAKELGGELVRGQKSFRWWGRWENDYRGRNAAVDNGFDPKKFGQCEHAIRLPGNTNAYEVGVVHNPDGSGHRLLYDNYGGPGQALDKAFGQGLSRLKREYSTAVAINRAKRDLGKLGWTTARETLPDGRVRVRVRKR